jgi:hypothetical protein
MRSFIAEIDGELSHLFKKGVTHSSSLSGTEKSESRTS